MVYVFRQTEKQAEELAAELRAEGFSCYWQKNNADSFEVRYWK